MSRYTIKKDKNIVEVYKEQECVATIFNGDEIKDAIIDIHESDFIDDKDDLREILACMVDLEQGPKKPYISLMCRADGEYAVYGPGGKFMCSCGVGEESRRTSIMIANLMNDNRDLCSQER